MAQRFRLRPSQRARAAREGRDTSSETEDQRPPDSPRRPRARRREPAADPNPEAEDPGLGFAAALATWLALRDEESTPSDPLADDAEDEGGDELFTEELTEVAEAMEELEDEGFDGEPDEF